MARRKKRDQLDELLKICSERGISSNNSELRKLVANVYCEGIARSDALFPAFKQKAIEIVRAGLAAQVSFLAEALGEKKLKSFLMKQGGVLDAIALHTSKTAEELEVDTGRDRVNDDGDVIVDGWDP